MVDENEVTKCVYVHETVWVGLYVMLTIRSDYVRVCECDYIICNATGGWCEHVCVYYD